ncbi:hypothetical protein JQN72_11365 [Phycicoccus sp. CSK15P-2]|uniref:hypothetical protein n=1 Tax=Phycicoccus sp. CSK15P-2 TaxID=2807627 RepID=UPI00195139D9|nr:hypothetical protein [Phycicoccus sp. CSK15P-2]MBM6404840.1 hypothetical protein [Phycicoccus sp. CSK15P-2]
MRRSDTEERTATRDLQRLVDSGLLHPHGQTRGRYYTAGDEPRARAQEVRAARPALTDPYPGLMAEIRAAVEHAARPAAD